MVLSQREPARLMNSDSTDEFTLRLLRSAAVDQPSLRVMNQAMVRVTASIAQELSTRDGEVNTGCDDRQGSEQAAPRVSQRVRRQGQYRASRAPLRITRAAGIGLLLGTSLAAAVMGVTQRTPPQVPTPVIEPARTPPHGKSATRLAPRIQPAEAEQVITPPLLSTPSATNQPREAKFAKAPNHDLREELALLDTAKTALSEANPRAALTALDNANQLSRRVLVPESTVLRVRALVALGRTAEARQVVERFVAQSPRSPVNSVLRELVGPVENHDPTSQREL